MAQQFGGSHGELPSLSNKDHTQPSPKLSDTQSPDFNPYVESRLAGRIRQTWERNRRARLNIDDRLLYCLRSRRGEYSPTELRNIIGNGGADPVFLKLTGTKSRAASSWIRDILLPAGDRPWTLIPSTQPNLRPDQEQRINAAALQEYAALAQAGAIDPNSMTPEDFMAKVKKESIDLLTKSAKLACDNMISKIEDLQDEGNWENALEEFIEDFVTYPTAFLKGPYYKSVKTLTWGPNNEPIVSTENKLCWTRISPFDMYPSPHAKSLKDGNLIERLRLSRERLYSMIGLDGYSESQIRSVLDDFERGTIKDWIWEEFERERLEADTTYFTSEPDTIDALHFWGSVKGDELIEWGITVSQETQIDPQKPYEIDAILIGNKIVRCVVNDDPLGLRPYHYACWDAVPSSIWGVSLPEQMEDHQKIVNACARALCNNMAIASGPQVSVLVDMLAENEDVTGMYPFKIWQMKSSMTGNSGKPVEFYQPNMNVQELLAVLNTFEEKADDVTNVPRYTYGNGKQAGAGNTASGLSMLLNSAAKGIRRAISHIDSNVIRPTIYQTFVNLMLNDPDPTIKGDCQVVPKGAAAQLIKEQNQVRVQTFLQQTANPIDMNIIGIEGRRELLEEAARLLDLPNGIVPSEEDMKARMNAQMAMAQQQQPQPLPSKPLPDSQEGMTQGIGNESQMQANSLPAVNQANPSGN